jgi:hypothetical protein
LIKRARTLHYLRLHAADAQQSEPGFPDLMIAGHSVLKLIETTSVGERLRLPNPVRNGRRLSGQRYLLNEPVVAGVFSLIVRPYLASEPEIVPGLAREIGWGAMLEELKRWFERNLRQNGRARISSQLIPNGPWERGRGTAT